MSAPASLRNRLAYWVSTAIIVLVMFSSALNFAFDESQRDGFRHLGLPDWFRWELTVAKLLGVLVLLWPRPPRLLKDFTYFGFGLTLVSADVAHLSVGDPVWYVVPHATFLAILVVSYAYRDKVLS